LLSLSHSTTLSSILLQWTQPFYFTEPSHFSTVDSTIFLVWTQPFCQTISNFLLNNFAVVNTSIFATLLNHFLIFPQWTQSFCDLVSHFCYTELNHFLIATVLSHSSLLKCSIIFWLLQCSVIFWPLQYSVIFWIAAILNHSLLLQC
jgi:hypothetical protein